MEIKPNDTLSLWREQGSGIIQQNFNLFRSLVDQAQDYVQQGKYDEAAVYTEMAAFYATANHCGLFVSWELEHILQTIGNKTIATSLTPHKSTLVSKTPRNILHVATSVMSIGGHSRMLWRWIQQDSDRCHSVVLTRQAPNEIPQSLKDAVQKSNGQVYVLNETVGSILSWAKQLQKIAATADLVVLHIHNYDVIPIIAFANKEQSPPIIFLDHADHKFWLGASISDLVVSLRESGLLLSQERRGITAERNVLLPIILEKTMRLLSRAEAKRQLGFPENSIVILSIARAVKYKTVDGISFADAHVPLLKKYEKATLVVVGPGEMEDWSAAIEQTQGRIRVFGETKDTTVFYQAADIYVDSFPFISNTSLLEAGSYGVPLVTRYPYSDASAILGADMPGLTGNLIRVRDIEEYTAVLSRLIKDEKFRLSLGEETRRKITETHMESYWQYSLNEVYNLVECVPRVTVNSSVGTDQIFLGEPDVLLPAIHGVNIDMNWIIQSYLTIMPFNQRLRHWVKLVKKYGFRGRISLLLPEWFRLRYYPRLFS